MRQCAVLASEDKLLMVAGNFASVEEIPELVAQLGDALADDCRLIFFVDNVAKDALVEVDGKIYALIQFRGGMVWNELMELLYVEKADLKGMSGEDKVKVLYEASKEFEPSFEKHTLDDVLASKTGAVREAWGAI